MGKEIIANCKTTCLGWSKDWAGSRKSGRSKLNCSDELKQKRCFSRVIWNQKETMTQRWKDITAWLIGPKDLNAKWKQGSSWKCQSISTHYAWPLLLLLSQRTTRFCSNITQILLLLLLLLLLYTIDIIIIFLALETKIIIIIIIIIMPFIITK